MIEQINQISKDLYGHVPGGRSGQTWQYSFFASLPALGNNEIKPLGGNFGDIAANAWPYQTSGKITMTTSGADDAAGTGARSVDIVGLRTDWTYGRETLATNAGAQATTNDYFALLAAEVTDFGTGRMNAQAITFQGAGGELMGQIEKFHGKLHPTVIAAADGYYAHIDATYTTSSNGGRIYIIVVDENGDRKVERFGTMAQGTVNSAGLLKMSEKQFAIVAAENTSGAALDVAAEVRAILTKTN